MTKKYATLVIVAASFVEQSAIAATCNVKSSGPADRWRFVQVYDVDRNEVVLRQAVKGGDSKPVTVSGERIRVAYKLPGATRYNPGLEALCKEGSTIQF